MDGCIQRGASEMFEGGVVKGPKIEIPCVGLSFSNSLRV